MESKGTNKWASRVSRIQSFRNRKIRNLVASYATNNNHSFTCKDIKEHFMETYEIILEIPIIRRILKETMNYSFKRWSPRPLLIDHSIWKVKKVLFAVKLLKTMDKSTVLINIDESAISNSTKANYSWGPKGIPQNLSTLSIQGWISLITAIASNGMSITGIKRGSVKADTFIEFLKHLLAIWNRL